MRRVPSSSVRAVALALAAGALVAGATVSSRSVELAAPHEPAGLPQSSDVLVTEATLLCPGQSRLGAEGLRSVAGVVRAAMAAPPASLLPRPTASAGGALGLTSVPSGATLASGTDRGRPVAGVVDPARPLDAVAAEATGSLAPGLAAAQTWLRTTDDDRGLALTPCAGPTSDLWLVGGGGGPARTERLVLTNPGSNAVTVRLEVLGLEGPVQRASDRTISIAPRSRTVVSLDAVAPGEPAPAVHVVATGGTVAGVLVDSWIDGATARGTDDATPAGPPATNLVVPGVVLDGDAALRLVNPGAAEAVVQVRLLTASGPVQPEALRAVRVPAGSTKDVPLGSAPAGLGGIQVQSDRAVTAGVWLERRARSGEDRMGDFGWAPASSALRGIGGLVLPAADRSRLEAALVLAAGSRGGGATVTTVSGGKTSSRVVTLVDSSAVRVPLGTAEQVWVTPTSGDVYAAVTLEGGSAQSPLFTVAALRSAPLTALSVPVRQVGS